MYYIRNCLANFELGVTSKDEFAIAPN